MRTSRQTRALLIATLGALLMAWFIYALLASAGCSGPACAGVSHLAFWAFPAGLILVFAGAFTGAGLRVLAPLFLAMGAAALAVAAQGLMPDMPIFPWLFGGGFLLGGLAALAAGPVLRHLAARRGRLAAELRRTGVKGMGTIVAVEDTGITLNDNPRVRLTMRIVPEDGSAPVERSKAVTVSRVRIPRAGDRHPAWFDRADEDKWMFGSDL